VRRLSAQDDPVVKNITPIGYCFRAIRPIQNKKRPCPTF
jgi:hypothetical protein